MADTVKVLGSYAEYNEVVKLHEAFEQMKAKGKTADIDTLFKNPKDFVGGFFKKYSKERLSVIESKMRSLSASGEIPSKDEIKKSRVEFDNRRRSKIIGLDERLSDPATYEARQKNADCKHEIRVSRWKKFFAGLGRALGTAAFVAGSVLFGALLGGPVGIGLAIGFGVAAGVNHLVTGFPFWRKVREWNKIIAENKKLVKADARVLGSDASLASERVREAEMRRDRSLLLEDEKHKIDSSSYLGITENESTKKEPKVEPKAIAPERIEELLNILATDKSEEIVKDSDFVQMMKTDEDFRRKALNKKPELFNKLSEFGIDKSNVSEAMYISAINGGLEYKPEDMPKHLLTNKHVWTAIIQRADYSKVNPMNELPDELKEDPELWIAAVTTAKANGQEDKVVVPESVKSNPKYVEEYNKAFAEESKNVTPKAEEVSDDTDLEHSAVDFKIDGDEKNPNVINYYVNGGGDLSKLSEEQLKLVTPETWKQLASKVTDLTVLPPNIQNDENFKKAYAEQHPELSHDESKSEDTNVVEETEIKYGESQLDKIQGVVASIENILNNKDMTDEEKSEAIQFQIDKMNQLITDGGLTIADQFKTIFDKSTGDKRNSILKKATKFIEALKKNANDDKGYIMCEVDENGKIILKQDVADSVRPKITSAMNEEEMKRYQEQQERIKREEEEQRKREEAEERRKREEEEEIANENETGAKIYPEEDEDEPAKK